MRRILTALVAAGALFAGFAMATPALAKAAPAAAAAPITLPCSPDTNGGTLVNGVCVLPDAVTGVQYEGFLITSNGGVDVFTITAGTVPPGLTVPSVFGAGGTIVGGTPTTPGTYTFSVNVTPFTGSSASTNGTYQVTVEPPPPLTVSFPTTCCNVGTVGTAYLQNFFSTGGTGPFTWTVADGQLPPGVTLTGSSLTGTPTTADTFSFTVKVTDSMGDQATESGSITITS